MKKLMTLAIVGFFLILVLFLTGTIYTVREDEQVIITQFGKPVGDPIVEAGLHFKMPFIQKVNTLERRVLPWDGQSSQMATRDKLYIQVDTFARWEISKPLEYYEKLGEERRALSRLDDILGSETRNAVAKHDLIEIIRTTKGRKPERVEEIGEMLGEQSGLEEITRGRSKIEKDIYEAAREKLNGLGVNLLDLRFKRINYTRQVESDIFTRMISERRQIAERFRSEGAGEAARTIGDMERDVKIIESEAYKKVQVILGKSEAESTKIYAEAYGKTPAHEGFYKFVKTLEAYNRILDQKTTVILSTDSDLFGLLKGVPEDGESD